MARPTKSRHITREPHIKQFSPRGKHGRSGCIVLKLEEYEAVRLSDHAGYSQKVASKLMKVSQQTFSRILKAGRGKTAESLALGKILKVNGGSYKISD